MVPQFELNTYRDKQTILDEIEDMRFLDETTNTSAALRYMRETMFTARNGDRPEADNIAIVITGRGLNMQISHKFRQHIYLLISLCHTLFYIPRNAQNVHLFLIQFMINDHFFLIFDVQLFMMQFTINGHLLLILSFFPMDILVEFTEGQKILTLSFLGAWQVLTVSVNITVVLQYLKIQM